MRKSRLSWYKQERLIEHFVSGSTARCAASLVGVNVKSAAYYFKDAEAYYATLSHELTHWTNHESRVNRDFGGKRFGDHGYAIEELVAELDSAFLCAQLGITPDVQPECAISKSLA